MNSLIERRACLDDLFKKWDLDEVYSKDIKYKDTPLWSEAVNLVLLTPYPIRMNKIFWDFANLYSISVDLDWTNHRDSSKLEDTVLIWKNGKWFI